MICWARYLFLALVAVLATGHMLAACGQKGPLYLPEDAPESTTVPARSPAPITDEDGGLNAEAEAVEAVAVPSGPLGNP